MRPPPARRLQASGAEATEARLEAYRGDRPDVRALIPPAARRVLDLGCATGAVGAALKRDRGAEVVGVEVDPESAAVARGRLDRVIQGDAEEVLPAADSLGRFDCLVAADTLEHLRDPWTTLARAVELLEPGGTAVVSLPNVRYIETFWQLGVHGRWPRRELGLFDRTHLRWFALRDARELLDGAGLEVTKVRSVIRLHPATSRFDNAFAWLGRTPLREFLAFQYLLVGVRRRER